MSGPTVDRDVDLLVDLWLVRRSQPWFVNTSKRLTKAPRIDVRDSGILHALLEIESLDELRGPLGRCQLRELRGRDSHQRGGIQDASVPLSNGSGTRPIRSLSVVEVKLSTSPVASAGSQRACDGLEVENRFVVRPDTGERPGRCGEVTVTGLGRLAAMLAEIAG